MAYWRMKLRDWTHGPDLWPLCEENGVAAITYSGVDSVDLGSYSRKSHPPGWNQIKGAAAKASIGSFAWDVRGGDLICVADSKQQKIVGWGYVKAPIGHLAYRFDKSSPIVGSNGQTWCHLIDVDWERSFSSFSYKRPRAPLVTVLRLKQGEIENFERAAEAAQHRHAGLKEEEIQKTLLLETAYSRYTPAALRLISREHAALSNQFVVWLQATHGVTAAQEHHQIDAVFEMGGKGYLAEFKIAYSGNTQRAIREALGQILEYNHDPPRESRDSWLLILNMEPSGDDRAFVLGLKNILGLPLRLGWKAEPGFCFEPPLNS